MIRTAGLALVGLLAGILAADATNLPLSSVTVLNQGSLQRASVTRPIDGGHTYSSGGRAICGSTTTVCIPLSFAVGPVPGQINKVNLTRVMLIKSTTGIVAATFRIWFSNGSPVITGKVDGSLYSPTVGDAYNRIGWADCLTQTVNVDNVEYECVLSNGQASMLIDTDGAGTIKAMLTTLGPYAAGDGEQFNIMVGTQ